MGLEVLIASRGEYSLINEVHDGLHIDLANPQTALASILKAADKTPFIGVLATDDSSVELAALAADKLGLPHNPPNAARLTRRKDLARAHLARNSCSVPLHWLVDLNLPLEIQMLDLRWPCVIKPLNLSASRGVIRVNNTEEFISACHRIKNIIAEQSDDFEKTHVLVEDYIDGAEVAYEGYLHQAELNTLAIFDKPDPLNGPYFEETIYVTPSRLDEDTLSKIKQRVAEACKAYGLTTGPIHAELRVNQQDAWILEVASRTIGGDCARTLDAGSGFNLEELAISLATARPIKVKLPDNARGVMMIPIKQGGVLRRVEGLSAARKVACVKKVDIIIREGSELIPLPEGNQYAGYIFAEADSADEVVHALRKAHAELHFVVAPSLKLHPQKNVPLQIPQSRKLLDNSCFE